MRVLVFTKPGRTVLTVRHPLVSVDDPTGFTQKDAEDRAWATLPPGAIDPVWVDKADLPADRTFRDAWVVTGTVVAPDIGRAKAVAHRLRRAARETALAPLDSIIAKRLPGNDDAATEAARQVIRNRDAARQIAIDAASSVAELRTALSPDGVGK